MSRVPTSIRNQLFASIVNLAKEAPSAPNYLLLRRSRRATVEQLEAEKERLRVRRSGQPLSVNGILGTTGTPGGGFLGPPKPPSAAKMLRDSAAEAVAASAISVRGRSFSENAPPHSHHGVMSSSE